MSFLILGALLVRLPWAPDFFLFFLCLNLKLTLNFFLKVGRLVMSLIYFLFLFLNLVTLQMRRYNWLLIIHFVSVWTN